MCYLVSDHSRERVAKIAVIMLENLLDNGGLLH